MKKRIILIMILSVAIFNSAYGEKIIAQPESREVYLNGSTYVQYTTSTGDPNFVWLGANIGPDHNDGSLTLAFKLPEIPAGQRITAATFHWFYVERYKLHRVLHDIYVLPYRSASASPVIVSEDGHFIGAADTTNAMLLKHNVCDTWDANTNFTINQWRDTSASSEALALFLQNQCYNAGAQPGDWFFIRFNQQSNTDSYMRETMRGPQYFDPNFRPYIEYTLGPAAERIVAQPETREVFYDGQVLESSVGDYVNNVPDVNYNRTTYSKPDDSPALWDGSLVLAFKLPQLPANKVISKASLKWYYSEYYRNRIKNMDLYAIPYRAASTNPLITSGDHYVDDPVGLKDATDALLLQQNIALWTSLDPNWPGSTVGTGSVNRWVSSDITGRLMAWFLQSQYMAGAAANDYIMLRLNPNSMSDGYTRQTIYGPRYFDPNYRPYIEYELVDSNEGSWRPVVLESQKTIINTGVMTAPPVDLGCGDSGGGVLKNMELIVPFQYPQLNSNEYIIDVDLTGLWGGRNGAANFDADLYGLPHRSSTSFVSTDYWIGPYAPLPGDVPDMNSGTPLQGDVFQGFPTGGGATWSVDPNGALRTACYMNDLKTAGATSSSYGFLRFGERFDFYRYERNSITTFNMWVKVATQAPTCLDAPETQPGCLFYDNPGKLLADMNYDCAVTFEDFAIMAERWMQCAAAPALYCN